VHVSDAAAPPFELAPRDGDVIVTRESISARFIICQMPGVAQLSTSSQDDAFRIARRFARTHAVDVWYLESGQRHLVETHRSSAGLPRSSHV
jgi:hypothetical protein